MASSHHCISLTTPSYANLSLSIFLLVGIVVSYLPQHYRIIRRRSSEGLSPYFVLLGTTSGTSAFANILLLPASRADLQCCKVVSPFQCFSALLGIAQVGTQWTCFSIILLLFLIFFPRNTPLSAPKSIKSQYTYQTAIGVALACFLHAAVTFVVSVILLFTHPSVVPALANFYGVVATLLACIQYFPQLYTTWRLRAVESLSIPMMCLQTPGSFLWATSLALRLGAEGWSAWGVYLVTGCLQGGLLVMAIYFELFANRPRDFAPGTAIHREDHAETDDEGSHVVEGNGEGHRVHERTPLLRNAS
ncbi:MAG: hypothetical protein M1838_000387 [Thelocarpon superellum]|nr:MAG: hypothetical protein M1838_000387 [Thelocarpon superellum]